MKICDRCGQIPTYDIKVQNFSGKASGLFSWDINLCGVCMNLLERFLSVGDINPPFLTELKKRFPKEKVLPKKPESGSML